MKHIKFEDESEIPVNHICRAQIDTMLIFFGIDTVVKCLADDLKDLSVNQGAEYDRGQHELLLITSKRLYESAKILSTQF
jgi:hypothetical protein